MNFSCNRSGDKVNLREEGKSDELLFPSLLPQIIKRGTYKKGDAREGGNFVRYTIFVY